MKNLSIVKSKKVVVNRSGLKVVHFYLNPGDVIPEHKTNVDVIVTTVRGKGIFTIGLVEHEMSPGVVLDMPPFMPHSIKAIEALEFVVVHAHLGAQAGEVSCGSSP